MGLQAICTKTASGNGCTKTICSWLLTNPYFYEASPGDSRCTGKRAAGGSQPNHTGEYVI